MDVRAEAAEFDLRHYLRVLRVRKRLVVLVALGTVGAALMASWLQVPEYEASADILLRSDSSVSLLGSGEAEPATVETEVEVISSDPVRSQVREELGDAPPVSASRVLETEVMRVEARSTDAERAALIANAYARAYIDFRRNQAVEQVLAAAGAIQRRIDAIQPEIDALDQELRQASLGDRADVEASIRPRYASLVTQQGVLQQTLDQLQIDATLATGGAQLVKTADIPDSPARPKPLRNASVALLAGVVMGVALALLRNHLDDSIKTRDDLRRIGGRLLVLGVIPVVDELRSSDPRSLCRLLRSSTSPAAEAYRSLRTSVLLLGAERPLRTVQVTSPMAGEGKSSTVVSLGTVLAAAGQRVVMVDCDLRRPRLHEMFQLPNEVGFTSAFLDEVSLNDAVYQLPDHERLFLLPSGRTAANPSEVLASKRVAEILFELQNTFDIVLVDSAPVLPVTDATVLAAWVEATLLVIKAGTTTLTQLSDAIGLLAQIDASVVGTVLNQAAEGPAYGYSYSEEGSRLGVKGQRPVKAFPRIRRTNTPRAGDPGSP